MKLEHPLFSPLGCAAALLLLAAILISIYLTGGMLFTPGDVSAHAPSNRVLGSFASHADFENDCTRCHAPWQGVTDVRCLDCHTDTGREISAGKGLHADVPADVPCARCHTDHRGRDFSSLTQAAQRFDHNWSGYYLLYHERDYDGTPLACSGCHSEGYRVDQKACDTCHRRADAVFMTLHVADYGADCLFCHDGSGKSDFDHRFFPLEEGHANLKCRDCHRLTTFAMTRAACIACHAEPEIHAGQFGTDCALCHTIARWSEVRLAAHSFPLDHAQEDSVAIPCQVCHPINYVTYTCYGSGCHIQPETEAKHLEEGIFDFADCMECHPTGREDEVDNGS